jgi:predicted RNA polymerase sigma factor
VITLNRAVAVSKVLGPAAGLQALQALDRSPNMDGYYLFHSVTAQLHFELKNYTVAERCFSKALSLTAVRSERAFLKKRLKACEEASR